MDIEKLRQDGLEAQHKVAGTKEISGMIQDTEAGKGGKGPKGHFYLDGEKYTCWDQEVFDAFKQGNNVTIIYQEKENEWNGTVYINRTIIDINYRSNNG